jgi:hypothetical protein
LAEYITGVSALTQGSTADPNMPVTTAQLAFNSTSATIRPYIEGYMRMRQMVAENAARWISVLIRGNKFSMDAYKEVIGDAGIEALIAADKDEAAYGFNLIARPNDIEKQVLLQNIEKAVAPDKNGDSVISADSADILINMVTSNTPVKTVQAYFKKARKQQHDQIMKDKKDLMDHQAQVNAQVAKQTNDQANALEDKTHGNRMELQKLQNEGGVQKAATMEGIKHETQLAVQDKKNAGKEQKEPQPA